MAGPLKVGSNLNARAFWTKQRRSLISCLKESMPKALKSEKPPAYVIDNAIMIQNGDR
jgi:hypothetical protein